MKTGHFKSDLLLGFSSMIIINIKLNTPLSLSLSVINLL